MIWLEDVQEVAELLMQLVYLKNKVAEANLTRGSIRGVEEAGFCLLFC